MKKNSKTNPLIKKRTHKEKRIIIINNTYTRTAQQCIPLKFELIHTTSTPASLPVPEFRLLFGESVPILRLSTEACESEKSLLILSRQKKRMFFPCLISSPNPVSSLSVSGQPYVARGVVSSRSRELLTWELRAAQLLVARTMPFVLRMKVSARAFVKFPEGLLVGIAILGCIL